MGRVIVNIIFSQCKQEDEHDIKMNLHDLLDKCPFEYHLESVYTNK